VAPSVPREQFGIYWGYNVRLAAGLSKVFSECPYPVSYCHAQWADPQGLTASALLQDGYDLTIGTSEKGQDAQGKDFALPSFRCVPRLSLVNADLHGSESFPKFDQASSDCVRWPRWAGGRC